MRIWGGTLLGALVCLLAGAATPAAASTAAPSFEVHERRLSTLMEVGASNGYTGLIGTLGHKQVSLLLLKGKTLFMARTSGRVTNQGIEADFGELGSVSVQFDGRPTAKGRGGGPLGLAAGVLNHKGDGPRCRGRKPILEGGVFRGRIRFEGENGFARIDSERAAGVVRRRYRQICRRDARKDSPASALKGFLGKLRFTTLQAQGRSDGARVLFEADAIDFGRLLGSKEELGYEFAALSVEHREGMELTRSVSSSKGTFLFDGKATPPGAATITPQKPFTGSAEYVKEEGAPARWSGTLAVRLPGAGLVPLTGPRFRSDICRLTFATKLDDAGCLQGSLPSLGLLSDFGADRSQTGSQLLAQGSGSQSQAFWDARLSWSR